MRGREMNAGSNPVCRSKQQKKSMRVTAFMDFFCSCDSTNRLVNSLWEVRR